MNQPTKRLYRSRTERQIAGIFGGLGAMFEMDPVLIRVAAIAVTCLTGFVPGIIAYLLAWIVIPDEPYTVVARPPAEPAKEGGAG